jgi:DNA polymerase-3 subunit alpha
MKRYLKELKPTVFEDIVAMVALYRPGPMQFIDEFIGRKHGTRQIVYPHISMENSLKNTYGVLVYQEQVMQISKEVCGFTGGEADTLRKAIGKKKADLMAKMKDKMIAGGQEHSGIDRALMERFWKQLEDFAAYCFNKSHAACYGLIAYQTAYLKAHYPAAFMAALMTSDYDDTDRLAIEISECQHMCIAVLPPDVDESFLEFAVVPDPKNPDNRKAPIRFGMNAIKNVGSNAVEEILRARAINKKFTDLEDFLGKVNVRIANRKTLESLVKAGGFDRYGDRSSLLENLDVMIAYAGRLQKQLVSGQTDLFGAAAEGSNMKPQLTLAPASVTYSPREQLLWERELLGLYLSQHPLSMFEAYLKEQTMPISELKPEHDGRAVTIGGAINDVREITTKNGQKMAFVKLEDQTGEIELILFPSGFQQTLGLWERDKVVLIRGKVSSKERDGTMGLEAKVIVDDGREITAEQAQNYKETGKQKKPPKANPKAIQAAAQAKVEREKDSNKRLYVRLLDSKDQQLLLSLKQTLDAYHGETEVVLVLGPPEQKQAIKLPGKISQDDKLINSLHELVGTDNVRLQ